MRIIIGVAIKSEHDGIIYSKKKPARHNHVMNMMRLKGLPHPIKGERGFICDDGSFINRRRAYTLACSNGQLNPKSLTGQTSLFSQDLW